MIRTDGRPTIANCGPIAGVDYDPRTPRTPIGKGLAFMAYLAAWPERMARISALNAGGRKLAAQKAVLRTATRHVAERPSFQVPCS